MRLRDLMFVLPNLFTVSSIFCGFYAMTLSGGEAGPSQLYQAALAIFFAMFFDGFDGRVARLTKTQSQFGMELDSLADVISFGAAPALLVYRWALSGLGVLGVLVSFGFAACGALRLARFNVLALKSSHGGASHYFVGMPIPFAACGLIAMIIAHQFAHGGPLAEEWRWPVLVVTLFLSLLMVSTVRYRTFKDVRPTPKAIGTGLAVLGLGIAVAVLTHPAWVLVAYFGLYLISGLIEAPFIITRKLKVTKAGVIAVLLDTVDEDEGDDEGDVDDEEIL